MWVMKKLIQVGVGGVLLLVDDDNDDERVSLSLSLFCCQMMIIVVFSGRRLTAARLVGISVVEMRTRGKSV